jgi:hypothetical protein
MAEGPCALCIKIQLATVVEKEKLEVCHMHDYICFLDTSHVMNLSHRKILIINAKAVVSFSPRRKCFVVLALTFIVRTHAALTNWLF